MKETLKKLRTDNRYSQDLLAKILGVSRLSYIKYESGEVEAPVEIIRKLAKIYNVSYKTIIDNELASKDKSVSYGHGQRKEYTVASSSPAYGVTSFAENSSIMPDIVSQFSQILVELQNAIKDLQDQLIVLKNSEETTGGFTKSNAFNKKDFFLQVGDVQIDSSYIEEIRGASLI